MTTTKVDVAFPFLTTPKTRYPGADPARPQNVLQFTLNMIATGK